MSLKGTGHSNGDITVPASVANLGGGFDSLAVAVQLYLRLRIVDIRDDGGASLTVIRSTPAVTGANAVERAFAAVARRTGLKAPSVFVEVDSDIPMSAGLGSSAAATVAGLRAFERVTQPLPEALLLAVAASLEQHADNAAAALHGGLTSVVERNVQDPLALRWSWPESLRVMVATPSTGLSTATARAALPPTLSRPDAVFNLQRVLLLVHALDRGEYHRLREGVEDRWHQPARADLVPHLAAVLALNDPEILGAFLSGAGPSVAVLARRDFARLKHLLISTCERADCSVTVRTLFVHPAMAPQPVVSVHERSA